VELGGIGCIIGSMFNAAIDITPELLALVASIDEFKGTWKALNTIAPERLVSLRKVATIESIGSSTRIEGSKLSDREVELLLSRLQIQTFESRDQEEVAGYAELMDLVFSSWREIPITENHIKQLHKVLMSHDSRNAWHAGDYKRSSNSVVAFDESGEQIGVVFETSSPLDTPSRMTELVQWAQEEIHKGLLHPLLIVGIFVVVFLEIHPFQDGNGRLSRALTTLLLLKFGYAYVPYASLESVIERNKEAYYLALRQTQTTIRNDTPNWGPWLHFFLRSLSSQVRHLEAKLEKEEVIRSPLPDLSLVIVDFTRQHGRIAMAEALKLTGSNRNTLKDHFRRLVDRGTLAQHGKGRGVFYTLQLSAKEPWQRF